MNGLTNIATLNVALGDKEGSGTLRVAGKDHAGQNTLGNFAYKGVKLDREQEVKIETIDRIVESQNLSRLDVIKMDIEGAEENALRGAERTIIKFKPSILIEINDASLVSQGSSADKLRRILEELIDYKLFSTALRPLQRGEKVGLNAIALPRKIPEITQAISDAIN